MTNSPHFSLENITTDSFRKSQVCTEPFPAYHLYSNASIPLTKLDLQYVNVTNRTPLFHDSCVSSQYPGMLRLTLCMYVLFGIRAVISLPMIHWRAILHNRGIFKFRLWVEFSDHSRIHRLPHSSTLITVILLSYCFCHIPSIFWFPNFFRVLHLGSC